MYSVVHEIIEIIMVNNRMESNHGFYDSGCSSPVPETRDKNGFEVLPNEENWVHIQDAELILQTLKQSFVVEELKDGLLRLQNLQIFTHIEVQKYLENSQVHLLVLSVMKHLSAFDDIQLIGLQLLCSFISHSCILEDSIKNSDTYSHVMEVLQNNISDSEIHKGGMKIFSCLLEDDYIKMKLKSEGRLNEVLDMVFKSIAVFKDDDGIQFYAFTSLAHLLRFDDETKKDMMKKFYQLMMDSLSINSCKPDIVEKILIIINILAHNEECHTKLVSENVHLKLMQYVKSAVDDIVKSSLEILVLLSSSETVCNDEVQSGFMMDILFPTLIGQPEEAEIQMLGLEIFQFTASGLFKDLDTADSASNWIRVIYTSMSQHLDSPLVQKSSCMALSKLLCCKPEAYMWIGESTELKQYPLHSLCLGTLLMYSKFEELYVAACDCFFYLAADNDALCKNLMEKNSHVAIIEGMKLHLSSPAAQASSCRALRGLCIFHDENKLIVSEYDDILQILVTILRRYGQNIGVLSEVMSTITCLADIDVIRHQCIVEKVHLHILSILDNFPDDRIIQEAGIEAIAVLGGAASGAEVLNYYRAVEKIIRGLLNFQYYINIQKKGLIAIQILADNDVLKSPDMCTELAQVIRMIMLTHKSVSSIQREAVVLMQILAEKGRPMSEVLVKQGCHEILFQILERYDDDRGLHDLASECLYVIGCEQNLKSSMLLAACAKGFLAGVECLLEIGSDVNIGEGQETPLYFAVKNQDENMVRLLLKHEVTDVRTPLRHSLDKQYHYITSLLLPYVDQDHDLKKAGTVIWNDFGLGNLRPEWFLSTFGGQKETRPSPGAGKNLFAKIKKSEQKRTKRLSHSPSDSYLEIMRHQCWRVRRNNCDFIKHKAEIIRNIREAEDLKSNTKRPKSFPKRFYRQGGDETKKSSSPTSDSPPKDKIEPALIIPIPDDPLFEHSEDEWEDWKKTTLTGANIPFSPSDPRRQKERTKRKGMGAPPVKWQRKYTQIEDPTYTLRQTLDQTSRQSLDQNSRRGSWDLSSESSGLFSIDFNEDRTRFNAYDTCTEMETSIDDNLEPDYMITPEFTMKCLDVSSNKISTFSQLVEQGEEFLKHFNQLQRLIASNNTISQFPMKFSQELTNLTTLDLKNNHLTTFPVELSACPCLSTVDLTKNQIQVFGLKKPYVTFSIRDLTLISNGLREFPNYLYKIMPHLEKLKLSKNNLDGVLDSPLHLPELRNLDLSHNSVKVIGDKFFTNCIKLETFAIANNGLETLPSEDISKSLARLYQLRLNKNNLYGKEPFYVPKFVLELPSLRLIELCDNGLIGFPAPSVWKSPIMKEVIFSRNLISKLNLEGAKAWSKLEKLHISHNRLSELPREIGQLISLQSFDFSHNKTLTTLPDELGKCSRLWEMPTDGCNIDLADSLLKGRVRDLIIYLHNRLKKAQRYFCMKLMVVGYGGRGKTTLLRALCKKYKKSAEDRPTVGVIVNDWKYERHKFGKNCAYTIRTWDFAGQEDFYSTHQCFLSNRAVYLIVYDVSRGVSEIDRLQPWLSNILARAPACPVIVVGTHYDRLNPDEYGKVQEIEEKLHVLSNKPGYPVILLRAMVDCSKETPEMEELRRRVKDIIDNFKVKGKPVMGQKVPASYVKLSELLSEEAKNPESNLPVLRRNQLLKLVQNAGLDLDEEELDQAVWFLHETGVLLHYNESALQLRDFYFINPGWLCRMMAQVVTVPQINPFISPQGIMKKDSAKWLFTGKTVGDETHFKFPHHLIPQYLRLLEKFEIALPRNNDELMIPCRLPAERPVLKINVHALPKDDKISRIYVMPSAPIGFWSRLITRLVVFSHSSVAEILLQLSVEPIVQYWREGIFVAWPKYAYFLVDSCKDNDEELHITVPSTTFGYRLLGYLVDHVDALVDEWYPGLTGIDPVLGRELLQKFAQCYRCTEKPKRFLVSEIIIQSETSDEIFCPKHNGNIELGHLAPDVMLTDLESHFQLDMNEFEFKDSPENLLGDGGFGSVFKAVYKKQIVAAKVFGAVGDDHPHKMLRQEVNILRRLNHPNVLSLTAVGLRPARLVLLEFAPVGSLGNVLRNRQPLSRILQHKIASQICEGMCYLHRLMVVYRDMKPDNVLIFNLSSSAKINAKISDYGISRFSTLYGLTAQEGTPAYRAPEVIKGETYSFQADVFSFGITLYVMVTGGQHPYDELEFQSEKDKAFAENLPIPPITKRGIKPWPDMQEVINQCLQQVPDYRPQSQEVCRKLRSAELYCLREFRPISVGTTVECMAYQPIDEEETKLWIASGDNDYMQFGWFNLLDYRDEFKGAMFPYGRILCMLPVDTEHILLGTQMGRIFVFDTVTREINHSTEVLSDSVLSLHLVQRADENNVIFAGLANGRLAFFPVSEILQEPDTQPLPPMIIGKVYDPVCCILKYKNKTIASCGSQIITLASKGMAVEKMFDTADDSKNSFRKPILTMALGKHLYISKRQCSVVELWDISKGKRRDRGDCNIETIFKLSKNDSRITAMVLQDKVLWIGTGGGQIVIVDSLLLSPLVSTARHTASIRCLMCIKLQAGNDKDCVILSGGLGFRNRPDSDIDKDNQYGCIAVWDSILPQMVKNDEKSLTLRVDKRLRSLSR